MAAGSGGNFSIIIPSPLPLAAIRKGSALRADDHIGIQDKYFRCRQDCGVSGIRLPGRHHMTYSCVTFPFYSVLWEQPQAIRQPSAFAISSSVSVQGISCSVADTPG